MNDYTIIGDYFPEDGKIIRIGNEGKEVVADCFIAYFVLNGSFKGYSKHPNERNNFKKSLSDIDFLNYIGEKRVKKMKVEFIKFLILSFLKSLVGRS